MYTPKADKRNTSNGVTPNRAKRQTARPAPKKVSKATGRSR